MKVLDVGCGIGGSAFHMAGTYGVEVHGVDLSTNMITLALENQAKQPLEVKTKVSFEICDITKHSFPEGSFDVVYSRDTILHIGDKETLFSHFYKWLKPGGRVLISDYCRGEQEHSEDFTRYVSQRGYHLLTVQQYGEVLSTVGFKEVEAIDKTSFFIDILKKEVKNFHAKKDEFVKFILRSLKILVTEIPISNKTVIFSGKFETKQPTLKNVPIWHEINNKEHDNMALTMEVDESFENVLAGNGTIASVTVSLHPLVIMNISEHWTRIRAQEGSPKQVIGALIGQQRGRHVEIMNSFELVFNEIEGDVIVDKVYYKVKEEHFKQVFSEMDFLGWYTTAGAPRDPEIELCHQKWQINNSLLILKVDIQMKYIILPIAVYESVIDVVNGVPKMLFVSLPYTLATEEAERIGVDHVAKVSAGESRNKSAVSEHLQTQFSAIKMLKDRVQIIVEYLQAMKQGEVPFNPEVLRAACVLSDQLPLLSGIRYHQLFTSQCNDVVLMSYLAAVTKSCHDLNQFVSNIICGPVSLLSYRVFTTRIAL
nr:EOG090X08T4 [Artemia franciscana]